MHTRERYGSVQVHIVVRVWRREDGLGAEYEAAAMER
jgi:hypothetical protein